ncbi:MAG: nicotinamide riboside transporter PnuC [Crocinitomicaceae bacterium]
MDDVVKGFIEGLIATSLIEWIAVATGVAYVILAARKSIFCWVFAIISSGIYMYLCISVDYILESFLQFFYVIMAIVGWVMWNKSKLDNYPIVKWKPNFHVFNIGVSAVICLVLGYYFDESTDQAYPYLDAFTTVFSLAATYMVMQRVLENWIYWIVIDIAGMFLYAAKGFYLSAVLYFAFTIIAVFGYLAWRKKYRELNLKHD